MDACPTCLQQVPSDSARWQIELPFSKLPLSLNVSQHHQVRAKKVRAVREATADLVELMGIPPMTKVVTSVYYSPRDNRRRDPINLVPMLKACEDGLVDAGVVPDDTAEFVRSVIPTILPKTRDLEIDDPTVLWFVVQEA